MTCFKSSLKLLHTQTTNGRTEGFNEVQYHKSRKLLNLYLVLGFEYYHTPILLLII